MSRPGTIVQFALSLVITGIILIPAPTTAAWQGGGDQYAALCDSGFVRLDNDDIEGARQFFQQVIRREPQ